MDSEIPDAILEARPHVHLWMTSDEAAEILDVPVGVIERKKEAGELEKRIVEDGTEEVLICLPEHPAVSVRAAMAPMIDALSVIERKLAPAPIPPTFNPPSKRSIQAADQNVQWKREEDVRRARRSARRARALAVLLLIAGVGGGAYLVWEMNLSQQQLADQSQRVAELNTKFIAEKSQLDHQLVEARQAAQKAQGELVVERSIEDTLLKAALRNHTATQRNTTAMIDSGQ